jgi:hypothetical protein
MYAKGPLPSLVTFIVITLYNPHLLSPKQGVDFCYILSSVASRRQITSASSRLAYRSVISSRAN